MKISYYLPDDLLTNGDLSRIFPEWPADKILAKTGIAVRHVTNKYETALDLAASAAKRLFAEHSIAPGSIDYLLLCTQSSPYRLPSAACILQHRLDIPNASGALSFDHGCSGYVYGLSIAKGLLASGVAGKVLFVTSETYSKYLAPEDKSTRTIFGDGAAATLLDVEDIRKIGDFCFGTDGGGAEKLMVRDGVLSMDGPEIFNFTLDIVPSTIAATLDRNGMSMDDIDFFVFHQANKFMLDTIRKVNNLSKSKFYVNLEDTGNTVSSTIPIALRQLEQMKKLQPGMKVLIMGFGVGLSWGATVLTV